MTSPDRAPKSRAGVMRLLNGAFWFLMDLACILAALPLIGFRLSNVPQGIIGIRVGFPASTALLAPCHARLKMPRKPGSPGLAPPFSEAAP